MLKPTCLTLKSHRQVFTRDVRPCLVEMRDTVDRSILEQRHGARFQGAGFNGGVLIGFHGVYQDLCDLKGFKRQQKGFTGDIIKDDSHHGRFKGNCTGKHGV